MFSLIRSLEQLNRGSLLVSILNSFKSIIQESESYVYKSQKGDIDLHRWDTTAAGEAVMEGGEDRRSSDIDKL